MKRLLFVFVMLVWGISAQAATYYMATDGSDSNTGATDSRWLTFDHAFGEMSAGDILILGDGTYTDATHGGIDVTGTYSGQPPNGTSKTNMTIIRSENGPGNVTIKRGLWLGNSTTKKSYIKIQGIKFDTTSTLHNSSYCYIKNCAFHSATYSTGSIFGMGTTTHSNGNTYNLIEDCWVYGYERLGLDVYNSDNNVIRRVVIRNSGSNYSSGNPSVGYTTYASQNVSVQNVIVLDRIQGEAYTGQDFAGVQSPPAGSFGQNEYLGCIDIGAYQNGWYIEPSNNLTEDDYTFRLINCVAADIGSSGDGWGIGIQGNGIQHDVLIDHCTTYDTAETGIRAIPSSANGESIIVQNCLTETSPGHGVYVSGYTSITSRYNQEYDNTSGSFYPSGSNNTSETSSSMLYLVKPGTTAITGNDSLPVGATIVKRYGTDGTFSDDTGYNTLSSTDLWPWPNEDQIKIDFASEPTEDQNPKRGFCADTANPRTDTGYITLTSYIWEYLGNTGMTASLYGVTPSTAKIGSGQTLNLGAGSTATLK